MKGQMNFEEYLFIRDRIFPSCGTCACRRCMYWWSSRCPHGECYDDYRSQADPYDKAHPDKPLREMWSNWNKPGEQAHWCRGGVFYPVHYCENFVKYQGQTVEECVDGLISMFQDEYIDCPTKNNIGCEACIDQERAQERLARYGCQYMTETGCEAHINALAMMAQAILQEGADLEMCGEQCCIKCKKNCTYRCSATG